MKLPFIDIHIVKGRNVVTEEQLERGKRENDLRNKMVKKLLDQIGQLKEQLRQK